MNSTLVKAALEALYLSRAHTFMRPYCRGLGAIFTLHHVRAPKRGSFQPNKILEIAPKFLIDVVGLVRSKGYDIVSLDEAHRRLIEPDPNSPFVCFTFDDGYRDNLEIAYPILKRLDVPMAVYVATSYPDRNGELWWLALEEVIRKSDYVGIEMDGKDHHFQCTSSAQKREVFSKIYWWMRKLPQLQQRQVIRDLACRYQVDLKAQCDDLVMSWDEIKAFAAEPLVTIGAHTVNHFALSCLSEKDARAEMINSAKIISSYIGRFPQHFSFPYGDPGSAGPREFDLARELGFLTAVTTRKGVMFEDHADHLTALPRISLNGDYQSLRYLDLFLSGAPFALKNKMRKLDVA